VPFIADSARRQAITLSADKEEERERERGRRMLGDGFEDDDGRDGDWDEAEFDSSWEDADQGPTAVDRDTSVLIIDLSATFTPQEDATQVSVGLARDALADALDDLGVDKKLDYSIKVVSTEVDELFREVWDDGEDVGSVLSLECSRTVKLRAYVVGDSRATSTTVRNALLGRDAGTSPIMSIGSSMRASNVRSPYRSHLACLTES
jgi:hypothetical protein